MVRTHKSPSLRLKPDSETFSNFFRTALRLPGRDVAVCDMLSAASVAAEYRDWPGALAVRGDQTDRSVTFSPTIQSSESAINQRSLHVLAYNLTRVMNIMGAQPRGSVRKGAVGSKQKSRKSTRCYVRAKRRVELRPSLDVPIIEFHNNRAKKKWCLHGTNNENSATTFLFWELCGQSIDRASNGNAWK